MSESVTPKLKLNIFAYLNSPLKIVGGQDRTTHTASFHLSLGHSNFILPRNLTHSRDKTLHDNMVFPQLQVLALHTYTEDLLSVDRIRTYAPILSHLEQRYKAAWNCSNALVFYCGPHGPRQQSVLPTVIEHVKRKPPRNVLNSHSRTGYGRLQSKSNCRLR